MEHTLESIDRNFNGSEIVLHAATKYNKRLIIASTSEIYGKNPNQPLHEESDRVVGAPQKIRWTYADAKALEEAVAHTLHKTHGLKVTTVRFFNTVGPRQTGQYGMVVPRFIQSALNNEEITIYDDGSQSRVFCHVEDAVRAVITLSETDSQQLVITSMSVESVKPQSKSSLPKVIERTNQHPQPDLFRTQMPILQGLKICNDEFQISPRLGRHRLGTSTFFGFNYR
jgi:nucleoside-diphosphate-sugar epimerase